MKVSGQFRKLCAGVVLLTLVLALLSLHKVVVELLADLFVLHN
jgi:hypothetical protein